MSKKSETDENQGAQDSTFSKIEFDKNTLFFQSLPNKISFDKVKIKNTGKTCVYFKWQKVSMPFTLDDKKSDGIDRFYCHYSDNKIFPEEEKEFTFSFFSEKNGLFSENWILATSPPVTNCNLNLHLNGMVHHYVDNYTKRIDGFNNEISQNGIYTGINEIVLDLVDTIKEEPPEKPDMNDEKNFRFYYEYLNKEYNVLFSKKVMKDLLELSNKVNRCLPYENDDERFWNGSIDELKKRIAEVPEGCEHNNNLTEDKEHFLQILDTIVHDSRAKRPEDSILYDSFKKNFLEAMDNFNDTVNAVKEEYSIPPMIFDYYTRQSLTEQELAKYDADLKKKRDDFVKKSKKKPAKNAEEEQNEQKEYRDKLYAAISNSILDSVDKVFVNNESENLNMKIEALSGNEFTDEYVERLTRVKTVRHAKNEGQIDNKYIVLRIDIDNFKREFVNDVDEEGKVTGTHLKKIDFLSTKDKMFDSLNYLLNNGAKAVLLLCDMGPKLGKFDNEYSVKDFKDYIEANIDNPCFYCENLKQLEDYNQKIEDEELKDNCCIVMENLNFFPEECGFDFYHDDLVNPSDNEEKLCLYYKDKFIQELTSKTTMYVDDSIHSFDKLFPTIIDVKVPLRVIGTKIDEQLKKITDFFSIETKENILVIGDNDAFYLTGKSASKGGEEETPKDPNTPDAETLQYSYDSDESMITTLLITSAIMRRFKKIFIFGNLGLQFIQFVHKDPTLFDNSKYAVKPQLEKLMKFVLCKAFLYDIKVVLPNDFRILEKEEYTNHVTKGREYTKEIKLMLKREKIQRRLEGAYTDEDELNDNADYIRVKLEDDQIEHLKLYKEGIVTIDRLPYCYNYVKEFTEAQEVKKPVKIYKAPMDVYLKFEEIYDKETVYPEDIKEGSELALQKEKRRLDEIQAKEEEERKKLEEEQAAKEAEEAEKAKAPGGKRGSIKSPVISPKATLKGSKSPKKEKKGEEPKEPRKEEPPKEGEEVKEGEGEGEGENVEPPKPKKLYDARLYNYDKYELVDYGDKSYNELIEAINDTNCIMWIGRLTFNKVENMFDNYPKIIEAIHKRKQLLKEKFEVEQATQEKKLNETELKARKQLCNVFLKGQSVYDEIRDTYKGVMNGNSENIDELEEEEEIPEDDEQFNHNMHQLVDYYINDDFELINKILKGETLPGFYGVNMEKPIIKEEEFDPKTLEEITN